ncbi:MAG: ankyrin repeat domain-containing protein [Acidobacteriota bacterium]|nr:ankyrin repeat domain-containing protein [Acidobacteriota bacterium]
MHNKAKNFNSQWMIFLLLFSLTHLAATNNDLRLVETVERGDSESVRFLLQQQVDVNQSQPDGTTSLHWAAHRDDVQMVDLLINAGGNVNVSNQYGVTPLSLACTNGSPTIVERLLHAGANANATQKTGETVLMTASRSGNIQVVNLLLAHGANVNRSETRRGQTALMWAVEQQHADIARVLIEHGTDSHAESHSGFTPLLFAAQQGSFDSIQILLTAGGVDVNETSPRWGSALVTAAARGHEQLALFLLNQGADPNATDGNGISALHYSLLRGLAVIANAPEHLATNNHLYRPNMRELTKALLTHGADPNSRIKNETHIQGGGGVRVTMAGATPLLLASTAADKDLVHLLIKNGADPELGTYKGVTPLMGAAGLAHKMDRPSKEEYKNALEITQFLVQEGANVNAIGENGWTALHGAAYIGADETIRFLVDSNAKLDIVDVFLQTPWSIAEGIIGAGIVNFNKKPSGPHPSASRLLLELGSDPMAVPELPKKYR